MVCAKRVWQQFAFGLLPAGCAGQPHLPFIWPYVIKYAPAVRLALEAAAYIIEEENTWVIFPCLDIFRTCRLSAKS